MRLFYNFTHFPDPLPRFHGLGMRGQEINRGHETEIKKTVK